MVYSLALALTFINENTDSCCDVNHRLRSIKQVQLLNSLFHRAF